MKSTSDTDLAIQKGLDNIRLFKLRLKSEVSNWTIVSQAVVHFTTLIRPIKLGEL